MKLGLQRSQQSQLFSTKFDQKITLLFCSCYRPPDSYPSWVYLFNIFLDQVCDQFQNMVICGDIN